MTRKHIGPSMVLLILLIALVGTPLFAGGGQEEVPSINFRKAPTYISPGSENGELILEIEASQVQNLETIRTFELIIFDKNGEAVFRQEATVTDSRTFLQRTFATAARPVIDLPENIRWAGEKSDSGTIVEDDVYFYQLRVVNSQGRGTSTPPLQVVVDTVPPDIFEITPTLNIFNPEDPGSRGTITFQHRTGPAFQWNYSILNQDGQVVWQGEPTTAQSSATSPDVVARGNTTWDGRGNQGNTSVQPDGSYRFVLDGVDRAGNTASESVSFRLSTDAGDLDISLGDRSRFFSPPVTQTLPLLLNVTDTTDLVSWTLDIINSDDIVVRRFSGNAPVPAQVVFNGKGNPGRPETDTLDLPDGVYLAELSALYANGARPVSGPVEIILDRQAPQGGINLVTQPSATDPGNPVIFGGQEKTGLQIRITHDPNEEWYFTVLHESGEEYRVSLEDLRSVGLTFPFVWDGTVPADAARYFGFDVPQGIETVSVADGLYQFTLDATDAAGNKGVSNVARFILDTADRSNVSIQLSDTILTPGQEGAQSISITTEVENADNLESMTISLLNPQGTAFFIRNSRDFVPVLEWNGTRTNGTPAPDGDYTVQVELKYLNGDRIVTRSDRSIVLGASPLLGRIRISPELFSPDGDGVDDTTTLYLDTSGSQRPVSQWEVEIFDPAGRLFKNWSGQGTPPASLTWDGRGNSAELVQSAADYFARLTVRDSDNNSHTSSAAIAVDVLVLREGDRLRILIPSIVFAPFTADLFDLEQPARNQNLVTLRRLAVILNRFPDYTILIEGHAVQLLYENPTRAALEQSQVLIPLSRDRATEVRQALTILGVDWERMSVAGIGGARPVVPHSDGENRWKNRRVEFILDRH